MSTNIEIIETLLLSSVKPLTGEEIVALSNVKKKSITSAITRLSRRRSDLCRTFHNGRSYYAIGEDKFRGELALDRDMPNGCNEDGAPVSRQVARVVRDRNGKFIKADTGGMAAHGLTEPQMAPDLLVVSSQEHLGEQRRRLAKMEGTQFPDLSEARLPDAASAPVQSSAPGNPCNLSTSGYPEVQETSQAVPMPDKDVNTTLIEHRKELIKAMNALEFERKAVKRVLRSEEVPQTAAKFATVTDPDLFRGWFNPTTGVKADRLGLEA